MGRFNYIGNVPIENYYFKNKYLNHCNLKFKGENLKGDIVYNYLTCNSTKPRKHFEFIGSFLNKENKPIQQYINLDYQVITNKETDILFIKSKELYWENMSNNIIKCIKDSDKMWFLEKNLNEGMEYFIKCYKNTNKFYECKQSLILNYDNAELILSIFFFK